MKLGINISIDVTKIEKARIKEHKNGGKYIDLTTFIDIDNEDRFGNNGFISQSVSKEERQNGVTTPILGNCKVFYNSEYRPDRKPKKPQEQTEEEWQDDLNDDLPF